MPYLIGLIGAWIFADGLISIRLYLNLGHWTLDETGKKPQSWKYDHSIRVIRCICGIALMVMGGLL